MKRNSVTLLVVALVLAFLGPSVVRVEGSSSPGRALPTAQDLLDVRHFTPDGTEAPVIRGLPERPGRKYPIPYHRPGQPAKTSVANAENLAQAYGLTEPLTMTTALELGVLDDPFQENYLMVDWDQILMVGQPSGANYVQARGWQAAELTTTSPQLAAPVALPNLWQETAWNEWHGVGVGAMAADLNGDGWDESIATFSDPVSHDFRLAVGQLGEHAGRLTSAPAVAPFSDDGVPKLRAAVQGYDGGVWMSTYDGAWGAWLPLGGNLASAPAVAGAADAADVYYLDAGGELWRIDTLGEGAEPLGAPPGVALTLDPAAAMWDTRTDVFMRGSDNALWHRARQGGTWSAWESLGGFLTSSPAAAWSSSDRLDVVAQGHDEALWQRTYSGGAWGAWQRVGGELASAPAILSAGSGTLDVFALNAAGEAVHLAYAGGAWGSWENIGAPTGGALTSTPAASWLPSSGDIHLLGRGPDDALWQSTCTGGAWGSWTSLGRLPECVITEIPWDVDAGRRNHGAGHFLGDSREQLVMFVTDPGGGGWLDLYEASPTGGFFLEHLDNQSVAGGIWNDQGDTMAVGDFDGDGSEEFAVLATNGSVDAVWVYRVNDALIEPIAHRDWPSTSDNHLYSLAAGDLDGDGTDELIVGGQIFVPRLSTGNFKWRVLVLNADLGQLDYKGYKEYTCGGWTHCALAVSAGNLYGDDGRDELAVVFANRNRDSAAGTFEVIVYEMSEDLMTPTFKDSYYCGFDYTSYLHHYLHAADLDRDLIDELVLQWDDSSGSYPDITIEPRLHVLWMEPNQELYRLDGGWFNYGPYDTWVDVAIGNLTGQGLRVGPPTYRQQHNLGNILAIIGDVPRHKDTLEGQQYNINADDEDTYVEYVKDATNDKEISVEAQSDWSLDGEASATLGDEDGTHVKASIGGSYGEHLEEVTGGFETFSVASTSRTHGDDVVVFTASSYDVYEYPIYQNDSTAPVGYLSVVLQQDGGYGFEEFRYDGTQCGSWYRPNHQKQNVWSYPNAASDFLDRDPGRDFIMCDTSWTVGTNEHSIDVNWSTATSELRASETKTGITAGLEGQVGGDKTFGFSVPWQVNFSVKGSYEQTVLATQATTVSASTQIVGATAPIEASAAYEVKPCLYWALDGYLVLDWVANPITGSAFWEDHYGGIPDPAFTRLYDPGQCTGQDDLSSDVYVNPSKVAPGDVVTATAIVRNFSDEPAANVNVRWYTGDPDAGGSRIVPTECVGAVLSGGDCQVASLPDRARLPVSAVFTADGAGEQQIYAVLDPDEAITEVHEDNNKAYGRLQIAAADYVDPGAVQNVPPAMGIDHSYAWFEFEDAQGNPTAAFVPLLALSEVTRVELRPVLAPPPPPPGLVTASHAFDLLAFQGAEESGWVQPIDLTFGGSLPAALAVVHYSDADVDGDDEASLALMRWTGAGWEDAVCAGMNNQVMRSPAENWLVVPVCQTGSYALFQAGSTVHLPLVLRGYP